MWEVLRKQHAADFKVKALGPHLDAVHILWLPTWASYSNLPWGSFFIYKMGWWSLPSRVEWDGVWQVLITKTWPRASIVKKRALLRLPFGKDSSFKLSPRTGIRKTVTMEWAFWNSVYYFKRGSIWKINVFFRPLVTDWHHLGLPFLE